MLFDHEAPSEMPFVNWRSPSLSELTPILFNMEITHLGSDASNCQTIVN